MKSCLPETYPKAISSLSDIFLEPISTLPFHRLLKFTYNPHFTTFCTCCQVLRKVADMETGGKFSPSYYTILGVSEGSSDEELRRAYRKLAMQWHPDKWTRNPSLLGEAKVRFQKIQEAYAVLSDPSRRTLYDAGLYDPQEDDDDDEVEGFANFLQEMVTLMGDAQKEGKSYSIDEIQSMFGEMAKGYDVPEWSNPPLHPASSPVLSSELFSGIMTSSMAEQSKTFSC